MEAQLNQSIQKMMTHVGANGICVADGKGMPIITKGNMDSRLAATTTQMFNDALCMDSTVKDEKPVIVVHTTAGHKLTIVNNHGETVTLQKK